MNSGLAVRTPSYASEVTDVELDVVARLIEAADPWGEQDVIRDVAARLGLLPDEETDTTEAGWRCVCGAVNVHPRCVCNRTRPELSLAS